MVCGIPAEVTKLAEGQKAEAFTPGVNGTQKTDYMGPYPPNSHGVHHYYFGVYALVKEMKLEPSLGRPELLRAIAGSILE